MTMPALRNIANGTPVDATDVEWNYNTIETYVNTELINADGTVAMQAPLTLQAGDPTNPTDAVNKQYVDKGLPAGVIVEFGRTTLTASMTDWLLCDGGIHTQATYPDLYGVIGDAFDTGGVPQGQFAVPDMRKVAVIGYDAGTVPFDTLGATGGYANATLPTHDHPGSTASQSSHQHTFNDYIRENQGGQVGQNGGPYGYHPNLKTEPNSTSYVAPSIQVTIAESGADGTNANYMPYIVIQKIIKT